MKNMPHNRESIDSIMLTASQVKPIPIQKSCGYMQISSESGENTHVPSAKKSEWNTANSPLKSAIAQINDEADTPYAGASAEELAAADEQYTLTPDAISHLDDVNDVVNRAMPALLACAVLAGFCLLCSIYMFGPRSIGQPFAFAGGLVVALFVLFGIWAIVAMRVS